MLRNLGSQNYRVMKRLLAAATCCLALLALASPIAEAQLAGGYAPSQGPAYGSGGPIQQTAASTRSSKQKRPLPPELYLQPDSTEQLEIIHHRSQLMVTRNPITRISIANPDVIDVVQYSPKEISVIGMSLGVTTLHIWFEGQANPLIYLVEVIRDPSFEERLRADFGKLEKQLQILFPNSKVFLIPLQSRLIVKGQAKDEEDAAHILQIVRSAYFGEWGPNGYGGGYGGYGGGGNGGYGNNGANNDDDDDDNIVNMLEVPGIHQVMLHVKVAELSRNELRRMGIDIRALIGRYSFGTGSLAVAAASAASGAAAGLTGGGTAANAGTSGLTGNSGGITGILSSGNNTMLFNWLAANHTGKILAAPTVTVLSGHEASFRSGGSFPVQTVIGVGGNQTSTTGYRGYGTTVQVQPQVIDRDWVKLDIQAEFSEIDQTLQSGGGSPALTSRSVDTSVKLREGQTIVLAGLFGHTGSTNVARIPFFGELPLIGPALFAGKVASQGENELLITVTPELVRPMEPDEVPPYPGFYVTWPNDIELYQYAKTEGYPDQGVYQLSPYGWGTGTGSEIGYRNFNVAPSQSAFGAGGGSLGGTGGGMGSYGVGPLGGGGYMATPQPSQIYPGPAVPPQAPAMGPASAPVPSAVPLQPSADPSMSGARQMGGIQQTSFEQPARNGLWKPWGNSNAAPANGRPNPVNLQTNGTAPSLQNGNDGRLGPNGQRHGGQQPRGRY